MTIMMLTMTTMIITETFLIVLLLQIHTYINYL